jgi:hypothetical protein
MRIGTPVDDLQSFVKHRTARIMPTPWHNCRSARELAAAIHEAALDNILNRIMRKPTGVRISNQRTLGQH